MSKFTKLFSSKTKVEPNGARNQFFSLENLDFWGKFPKKIPNNFVNFDMDFSKYRYYREGKYRAAGMPINKP